MKAMLPMAVIAGLFPAAASAATVTAERMCTGYKSCDPQTFVTYTAAPGEVNALELMAEGETVVVADRVPIVAAGRCRARPDGRVRCPGDVFNVALADGDDRFTTPGGRPAAMSRVDGGEGDDVLAGTATMSGGAGRDRLTGGALEDRLTGGAGADVVSGGDGDDWIAGDEGGWSEDAPPATDVLDGGAGANTVSYEGHTEPVHVDLAAAAGGAAGEGDRLSGFVHVYGSERGDTLIGDARPNRLMGGGGRDAIAGGDGADDLSGSGRLDGGPGDDQLGGHWLGAVLIGGAGDDYLSGVDARDRFDAGPGADRVLPRDDPPGIRCGTGRDALLGAELLPLPADCELVDRSVIAFPGHPRRLGRARLAVPVPLHRRRAQTLELRLPRKRPFATVRVPAGRRWVRVTLPQPLRDRRRLVLRIRVRRSPTRDLGWTVALRGA